MGDTKGTVQSANELRVTRFAVTDVHARGGDAPMPPAVVRTIVAWSWWVGFAM